MSFGLASILKSWQRWQSLGRQGERRSARYLKQQGYRLLARNLVVGKAEIDLLALTPNQKTLVVIEVKTTDSQSASSDATLMQRVDARKQQLLKQAAVALVRRHRLQGKNIRFDIITVKPRSPHGWQITHIPAAFT